MSSAAETPAEQNGNSVAESFLLCLEKANHQTSPFDFWLLEDVLPEGLAAEIANLPFDPPSGIAFSGQRESNNATRIYFSEENQGRFDVCRKVADGFKSPAVIEAIERETGANLSNTRLRIEYCQDTQGFWLEPPGGSQSADCCAQTQHWVRRVCAGMRSSTMWFEPGGRAGSTQPYSRVKRAVGVFGIANSSVASSAVVLALASSFWSVAG